MVDVVSVWMRVHWKPLQNNPRPWRRHERWLQTVTDYRPEAVPEIREHYG